MALLAVNPFLPSNVAAVELQTGTFTEVWRKFFEQVSGQQAAIIAAVNAVPGVNVWALAAQPTLGPADAGYLAFVTDYGHFVRWTGTVWQFAPGDVGNGFFRPFAITPQEVGWQLCDGTATTYLVVGGATLTTAAFTTPALTTSPAYLKTGAAYTGAAVAKSGSTGTGTTGTGTTGTGTTGTGTTGAPTAGVAIGHTTTPTIVQSGTGVTVSGFLTGNVIDDGVQTHPIPGLSVPGLSVPGLSVPALAVGTIDVEHLVVLPYFRR